MQYPYLDNFVKCHLDHNNGFSDEEMRDRISEQLSVCVYKTGLETELYKVFVDPKFSWLFFFKAIWDEPGSNNLNTEDDARKFAVEYIWNEVSPNITPSKVHFPLNKH